MIWPFLLFWKGDRKTITVKQALLFREFKFAEHQKYTIVNSKCHATCIYEYTVRYNVRCWNQCIRFVFIRNLLILLKNVEYCWQYLLLIFLTYLPDNTELPLAAGKRTYCSYLKFITWSTSTSHSSKIAPLHTFSLHLWWSSFTIARFYVGGIRHRRKVARQYPWLLLHELSGLSQASWAASLYWFWTFKPLNLPLEDAPQDHPFPPTLTFLHRSCSLTPTPPLPVHLPLQQTGMMPLLPTGQRNWSTTQDSSISFKATDMAIFTRTGSIRKKDRYDTYCDTHKAIRNTYWRYDTKVNTKHLGT